MCFGGQELLRQTNANHIDSTPTCLLHFLLAVERKRTEQLRSTLGRWL